MNTVIRGDTANSLPRRIALGKGENMHINHSSRFSNLGPAVEPRMVRITPRAPILGPEGLEQFYRVGCLTLVRSREHGSRLPGRTAIPALEQSDLGLKSPCGGAVISPFRTYLNAGLFRRGPGDAHKQRTSASRPECPMLLRAAGRLRARRGHLRPFVGSLVRTDPWTLHHQFRCAARPYVTGHRSDPAISTGTCPGMGEQSGDRPVRK